jgi:hypothetical protein
MDDAALPTLGSAGPSPRNEEGPAYLTPASLASHSSPSAHGVTVTTADADLPSTVTVMVAFPGLTPVTTPS